MWRQCVRVEWVKWGGRLAALVGLTSAILFGAVDPAVAHADHSGVVIATDVAVGEYQVSVWSPADPPQSGEWPLVVEVAGQTWESHVALTVREPVSGTNQEIDLRPAPELGERSWFGMAHVAGQGEQFLTIRIADSNGESESQMLSVTAYTPNWLLRLAVGVLFMQAVAYSWWLIRRAARVWSKKLPSPVLVAR